MNNTPLRTLLALAISLAASGSLTLGDDDIPQPIVRLAEAFAGPQSEPSLSFAYQLVIVRLG